MSDITDRKLQHSFAELISVIVIIAFLSAALVVVYYLYIAESAQAAALIEGQNVYTAAFAVAAEDIGTGTLRYFEADGDGYALSAGDGTPDAFAAAVNAFLGEETVLCTGSPPPDTASAGTLISISVSAYGNILGFVYIAHNGYAVSFSDGYWSAAKR